MRSSKRWTIWVSAAIVAVVSYGIVYAVNSTRTLRRGSRLIPRLSGVTDTCDVRPHLFNTSYDNLDEHLKFKRSRMKPCRSTSSTRAPTAIS